MQVGDVRKFNVNGRYPGSHFGIKNGTDVKITAINGEPYTYAGLPRGETCRSVSFVVIETGEVFEKFSSQWIEEEDGLEL